MVQYSEDKDVSTLSKTKFLFALKNYILDMYNVPLLKCYANHAFLEQYNFQKHHPSLHMILETSAAAPLFLVMRVTML